MSIPAIFWFFSGRPVMFGCRHIEPEGVDVFLFISKSSLLFFSSTPLECNLTLERPCQRKHHGAEANLPGTHRVLYNTVLLPQKSSAQ